MKNTKALLDGYIPAEKFQAVKAAILKQCDKADGVSDGLIQNPAKCAFQPDALVSETLTQKQADALKDDREPGARRGRAGSIYPGASVGNLGQDKHDRARRQRITLSGACPASPLPPSPGPTRRYRQIGRSLKIF